MNRLNATVTLNPIGANERDVVLDINSDGVTIHAGCFTGTVGELRLALERSYQHYYNGKRSDGETGQYEASGSDIKLLRQYKAEYRALCDFAEALQTIWTRKRVRNGPKKAATRKRKRA